MLMNKEDSKVPDGHFGVFKLQEENKRNLSVEEYMNQFEG